MLDRLTLIDCNDDDVVLMAMISVSLPIDVVSRYEEVVTIELPNRLIPTTKGASISSNYRLEFRCEVPSMSMLPSSMSPITPPSDNLLVCASAHR